jgi:hypothetical protein
MAEPGWIDFYVAAVEIEGRFDLSKGAAEKKLREACASGDLRSWKQPYARDNGKLRWQGPWERILPSEWRLREIDLMSTPDGCNYLVRVSEDDFRRWLSSLAQPRKHRNTRHKRTSASQAIAALWPAGIPEGVVAKEIVRKVSNWLKAQDLSEVSGDTILRAAGRKR